VILLYSWESGSLGQAALLFSLRLVINAFCFVKIMSFKTACQIDLRFY